MDSETLNRLARDIESGEMYDAALCRLALDQVELHLPEVDRAMIRGGALGQVDAVLAVIDDGLPGWSLAMHGLAHARDGHWRVALRRSADADETAIGAAHGPRLSNALIAALLRALANRGG